MPGSFDENYGKRASERFERTLKFMEGKVTRENKILDIGPTNPMSDFLKEKGFDVDNTPQGQDLDLEFDIVKDKHYNVVTSFEIFEHMVSPFPLLRAIEADTLITSVPLRLWFSTAYWNDKDPFDRHYHEFEPRQFDMLLEKAGWEILDSEQWTSPVKKLGIRPILRRFVPRYYIVYCKRKK